MAHTFYIPVPREALEEAYKALSALARNTLAPLYSSPPPPVDLLDLLALQASQRSNAALTIALALRIPRAQAMADLGLKDLGGLAGALLGPEGLPLGPVEGAIARAAIGPHKPISGQQLEALSLEARLSLRELEEAAIEAVLGPEAPSFEDDLGRLLAALEEPIASAMGEEGLREFEEAYNKVRAASYDLLRLPPEDPEEGQGFEAFPGWGWDDDEAITPEEEAKIQEGFKAFLKPYIEREEEQG